MNDRTGTDPLLARAFYTGTCGCQVQPILRIADFEYTVRYPSLLDAVAARFGDALSCKLPPEHRAKLERGETQSPEDMALCERMQVVQAEAFRLSLEPRP